MRGPDVRLSTNTEPMVPPPIPMVLHCPRCGAQHIDQVSATWSNPPHRSHLCALCGCIWRPCDLPTVGVGSIETAGKADSWTPGDISDTAWQWRQVAAWAAVQLERGIYEANTQGVPPVLQGQYLANRMALVAGKLLRRPARFVSDICRAGPSNGPDYQAPPDPGEAGGG